MGKNTKGNGIWILITNYDNWSQQDTLEFSNQPDCDAHISQHKLEWDEYRLIKGIVVEHIDVAEELAKAKAESE